MTVVLGVGDDSDTGHTSLSGRPRERKTTGHRIVAEDSIRQVAGPHQTSRKGSRSNTKGTPVPDRTSKDRGFGSCQGPYNICATFTNNFLTYLGLCGR